MDISYSRGTVDGAEYKTTAAQRTSLEKQRKFDDVKHAVSKLEAVVEIAVLTCLYFFVWKTNYRDVAGFHAYLGNGKYVLMGIYAVLVMILFLYSEGFRFGHLKLTDVLIYQWISLLLVNLITYFQLCLIANHMISPVPMLLLMGVDMVLSFFFIYVFTLLYHRLYVPRRMVMIYGTDNAVTLKLKMNTRSDKYRIVKLLSVDLGFDAICREILQYDAVVINDVPAQIRNDLLKFCYEKEIRTYMAPKITDILIRGASDITLFDTPLILMKGRGLNATQRLVKRTMDLVLCGIAMIPGSLVMLFIALAIKLEDHGPVFYRQERVTMGGKTFQILKFRSMIVNAEAEGKSIPATEHDPRITKVGRLIRATRLDELPQILNILKGDMSIVGPRPERVEHVKKYTEEIPEFMYRTKVKGGLTGFAQIYGKYNTSAYDKLRLDLIYIENYSLMMDIKLILMTLRVMLKKESTEGFGAKELVPVEVDLESETRTYHEEHGQQLKRVV